MSQTRNIILSHLQAGGVLTKLTAIAPPFSTTNLGDKILKLRREGHDIQKRWKETAQGNRYAEYFLPKSETQ